MSGLPLNIKNKLQVSDRITKMPLYVFAELAERKALIPSEYLIDLSLGSPDSPTPDSILNELESASRRTSNHGYPRFNGKESLIQEIMKWAQNRFNITLKEEQVLPLLGSKEGLAHLPLAYLNPGDVSLIPNPHYPVYYRGSIIAGAEVIDMPLYPENNFLPDLSAISPDIANKAKFMIVNYPNNPTGAVAGPEFMRELVSFCRQYNILLCHDLAYSEMGFYGYKPQSIFEYMSLDEPVVEFFTFSKTYHMAGWRIGFCLGNQDIVQTLYRLKTNMDYGVSGAIQDAATAALQMPSDYYDSVCLLYQERAELVYNELKKIGLDVYKPGGAMYIWVKAPAKYKGDGRSFALDLLTDVGISTTPGLAFGEQGTGYVRIALVQSKDKLQEAIDRIKSYL